MTPRRTVLALTMMVAMTTFVSAAPSNLYVPQYYQKTGYWCVPTAAEMVIKYVSGRYITQSYLAWWMGTTRYGTLNYKSAVAVRAFTGQAYYWGWFSRNKVIYNINRYKPITAACNVKFFAYAHRWTNCFHHVVFKGYTSGGFILNDPAWGPNKWVSNTEAYNTFRSWDGHCGSRY